MADIDSVTAINNCVNNSVTAMTNRIIIFWKNDMIYDIWTLLFSLKQEKQVNFSDLEDIFWVIHILSNDFDFLCCKYNELDI